MLCAWQTACVKCVISICVESVLRCMPKMAQKLTHAHIRSVSRCQVAGGTFEIDGGVAAAWQLSGKSQNHKSNHNTRLKVVAALAASVGGSLCVCCCCGCLRLASHKEYARKDCGSFKPPSSMSATIFLSASYIWPTVV